ncbi:hypothetical protein FQA39_LY09028 [Lamprigera yunnana]|nr:hypothetical protein FQA39_LY09028 [Lamprigera yunnana]
MEAVRRASKKKPVKMVSKNYPGEVRDKICLDEKELPVKVFEDRQSVLTELFENKHIQSIYRVIAAVFMGICINTVAYDYLYNGDTRLGFRLILKGFRNFYLVFSWWFCLFLLSFCPYFGVKYWFVVRNKLKNSLTVYFWDRVGVIICALFLIGLIAGTSTVVVKIDVGFASGVAAVMETLRIVMKIYAFCRVNVPVCLKCKLEKNYSIVPYPKFKHYLYFSFAPTLIYRHSYPRSSGKVRWSCIAMYLMEFICSVLSISLVFERTFLLDLHLYGLKPYETKEIFMIMLNNSLYGLTILFLMNYTLLHVWLNAFAEILKFSDRLFYKDWWTSKTYERYYRTWNTVVHDWLYTYIYKDCYEILTPKKKIVGKLLVFLISSIMHDLIVSLALGFFLPIFIIFFLILGTLVTYIKFSKDVIGNVFFFYTIGLGASMMFTLYTLEYYARLRCDNEPVTVNSYFIPKLFNC